MASYSLYVKEKDELKKPSQIDFKYVEFDIDYDKEGEANHFKKNLKKEFKKNKSNYPIIVKKLNLISTDYNDVIDNIDPNSDIISNIYKKD